MIFLITTIARTIILYGFVTFGVRIMGKRQIGDMQPNELVITLLISEIAAIPLQDTSKPILFGVVSVFMLVILEIVISVLAMKSRAVRKLMSGRSVVIIKNGEIDQSAMKSVRMTVLDLIELLRGQNVFDISTVAFAVLEVNGDLSVLLKSEQQTPTLKDLDIKTKKAALQLPVITDGKLENDAIKALGVSMKEIEKVLKNNKTVASEVFLMCMDRYKNFTIVKKR